MIGVILAAGQGTRLGALSANRSKAMQPIAGLPMIERVLIGLYRSRVDHFVIVVHPEDKALQTYLRTSLDLEATQTIVNQREQMGMAHALLQAVPHLVGERFVLSACDNLVPQSDLERFITRWQNQTELDGLLALMEVSDAQIPSMGIVAQAGDAIVRIVEKPQLSDAPSSIASIPLYGFSPRLLTYLEQVKRSPRGEYELQDAIQMLINGGGKVQGLMISQRMTVSRPTDLLAVNRYFLRQLDGTQGVLIEEGASVGANCQIGPEVYVEAGTVIGDNVQLRRSVVLRGAQIPSGAVIEGQVIGPLQDKPFMYS